MRTSRTQLVALLSLALMSSPAAESLESVESVIPAAPARTAGEIKAMIQLLTAPKGASQQDVFLARVRQYRYLCGVPFAGLAYDAKQGELAHAAAAIDAQLGKLTHTPEQPPGMSDADYQLGRTGAGQCNLFQGITEPAACVDGWMFDSDPSNIDRVGHRRWILNPAMGTSAFGTVGRYAAMYACDGSNKNVPDWDVVAYPTRGAMPVQFFRSTQAWSVSPNTRKYTVPAEDQVKVTIHAVNAKLVPQGEALKIDYFHVETGGFGSGPAVIFRPEKFTLGRAGALYAVTLTGLKTRSGTPVKLQYTVDFFNLARVEDGAEGALTYTQHFQSRLDTIQAMPDKMDRLEALEDFLGQEYLPHADPKVRKAAVDAVSDLTKEPALKRELTALDNYQFLHRKEQEAGTAKDHLTAVALGYRDLAKSYKETRAGARAADDYNRLKTRLEGPGSG